MPNDTNIIRSFRIKKSIIEGITDDILKSADCRTVNEFVGEALQFYISFLHSKSLGKYMSKVYLSQLEGMISMSDERNENAQYKLAVLTYASLYLKVLEGTVSPELFEQVLRKSSDDVKGLNGYIDYDKMFRSIRR